MPADLLTSPSWARHEAYAWRRRTALTLKVAGYSDSPMELGRLEQGTTLSGART